MCGLDSFYPRSTVASALTESIDDITQEVLSTVQHFSSSVRTELLCEQRPLRRVYILFSHLDSQYGNVELIRAFQRALIRFGGIEYMINGDLLARLAAPSLQEEEFDWQTGEYIFSQRHDTISSGDGPPTHGEDAIAPQALSPHRPPSASSHRGNHAEEASRTEPHGALPSYQTAAAPAVAAAGPTHELSSNSSSLAQPQATQNSASDLPTPGPQLRRHGLTHWLYVHICKWPKRLTTHPDRALPRQS
ncbi:hypothetical protein MIND_00286300 [Mycena indigotica]|uniref:Uncharacterized protein n=1 Tax=Mycena indigotica TaxID=2126181 RepID=A0A8H6TBB5_9AGAR|nr:uncharacterized protein MIND_00286300 [Mycena indigotica]KAF7312715.1 hypothetical protein MIND_00286300 [Mycena indigotica]